MLVVSVLVERYSLMWYTDFHGMPVHAP